MRCMSKECCKVGSSINMDVCIVLAFWWVLLIQMVALSRPNHKIVAWVMSLLREIRIERPEWHVTATWTSFLLYKENFRTSIGQSSADTDSAASWLLPDQRPENVSINYEETMGCVLTCFYLLPWIHLLLELICTLDWSSIKAILALSTKTST